MLIFFSTTGVDNTIILYVLSPSTLYNIHKISHVFPEASLYCCITDDMHMLYVSRNDVARAPVRLVQASY